MRRLRPEAPARLPIRCIRGAGAVPYLTLRPVWWLAWLSVRGWRLYRDRAGRWYVVNRETGGVRPLWPRRPPGHDGLAG